MLSICRLCFHCVSSYLKLILLFGFHGADIRVHIPSRCIIALVPFAHIATERAVLVLWVQQVKEAVWELSA